MTKGLRLRSLSFHGPVRTPALIEFGPGLNVIYGASNTGKSFIVNTIDFMLGGRGPVRDIPERIGYAEVLLAVETLSGDEFTIRRSVEGGAFRVYDGLYGATLPGGDGRTLAEQHSDRNDDNLSAFLLKQLDLSGRRIRRNKRGDTNSLSFRNVARLLIVDEEEIIQQRSPLSDGNVIADTPNTATFKLLLTGVDDSALQAAQPKSPEEQTRGAQLELLDQLIDDYRRQVKELAGPREELEDQLGRLDETMSAQGEQLAITEAEYRDYSIRRRDVAKKLEDGRNRLGEVTALLDRFTLLEAHYRSDIARLQAIVEAGSLFGALSDATCPLCGSAPEHHRLADDCDGNVDRVVEASRAEMAKIELRQTELAATITDLRKEAVAFERRLPTLEQSIQSLSSEIDRVVAPNLRQLRTSYKSLADKGGEVREALAIHRGLQDLEDRKAQLEKEDETVSGGANSSDVDLSTTIADKFATVVLEILTAWHFPDIQRVHFDTKLRDLVINGKNRTSYGKGLRAITQAAFTIGLMEYCRRNDTPHPGFTVLDSPLLSYKAPEGNDDDLRGTDLKDRFYTYLSAMPQNRQVLVIENTDPPADVQQLPQAIKFSGSPGAARIGFFPPQARS
ncbi:MAG: AAA family ATPase [Caulobacterales bacterium]|nr:AAA family ATPase [Caulobacterales bacterium]